jgi:serine/threonine-protein kinase
MCDAALALPSDRRAAFVREAGGNDTRLQAEVEALLAYASRPGALDHPLGELAARVLGGSASLEAPALAVGTRFGVYEMVHLIDAGGTGQVYRARDTDLGRFVALKVLRPEVAADRDRSARLEHEARVLAALSHPNIAAIYGVVRGADRIALAMELVEGQTLAARLAQGALSVADADGVVRQMAGALETAHDHGVVHRDLTPSNVMVTAEGLVKVLDFGLAKMCASDTDDALVTGAGAPETGTVTVMGTAAYMSPEQAMGQKVDRRTDIWALGCVWYELLTGFRAFAGNSSAEIVAAVLREEPDWSRLPAAVSPRVRAVLRRCLAKPWHERLHDMSTVRFVLDESDTEPAVSASGAHGPAATTAIPNPLRTIAAVIIAALALGSVGAWRLSRAAEPRAADTVTMIRSTVVLPEGVERSTSESPALSRDGKTVIFPAVREGRAQLFRRRLADAEVTPIDGTEGGTMPFLSPDGQWLGFAVGDEIKKMRIEGGPPQLVARLAGLAGASWGDDDVIIVGRRLGSGLWRVPASGGTPERLTAMTSEDGDNDHRFPQVLPRGRGILFCVCTGPEEAARIVVLDARTGARRDLLTGSASARYVATGHLVYARNAELLAVPFDLDRLEITGAAVRVVEGVNESTDGVPEYADASVWDRRVLGRIRRIA